MIKNIAPLACLFLMGHIAFAQNVGIGTSAPAHRLDVEGDIRAKGTRLYIGTAGSFIGSIGSNVLYANADWEPSSNINYDMGNTSFRWRTIFANSINLNQSIFSNGQGGTTGIYLGTNVASKELNAGRIGYSIFTPNALDIVGGGNSASSRKIKLWAEDEVEVTGDLRVAGKIQRNSTGATNLVPIALASVNVFGTVDGGTGNVSVVKNMSSGLSEITIAGEFITINGYIIQVTPVYTHSSDDIEDHAISIRILDGKIRLYTLRDSTASNSAYHIVIYKLG